MGGGGGLWVVGLASFTFVFRYVYVRCLAMFRFVCSVVSV